MSKAASLINEYGRAVVHLRQQLDRDRLGVVLGAGVGSGFGFPSWSELISRIAASAELKAEGILRNAAGYGSKSQLLFQLLRRRMKELDKAAEAANDHNRFEVTVLAKWREITREALYREVPTEPDELLSKHPYIGE